LPHRTNLLVALGPLRADERSPQSFPPVSAPTNLVPCSAPSTTSKKTRRGLQFACAWQRRRPVYKTFRYEAELASLLCNLSELKDRG
jgi:hypothetical protein